MQKHSDQQTTVDKADYKKQVKHLRVALLDCQLRLSHRNKPVIIVIAGDDRSGRHETINTLLEWLDPRFIQVNAYRPSGDIDEEKPFFWRFWRDLPAAGHIGIYLREWTSTSIVQFLNKDIDQQALDRRIENIKQFERTLTDDGAKVIKVWLHLSKEAHRERVKAVRDTAFFDPKDELALRNYDEAVTTIESVLKQTNTASASWHIISGEDVLQRNLDAGHTLLSELQEWLEQDEEPEDIAPEVSLSANLLDHIDLTRSIGKDAYQQQLEQYRQVLRQRVDQAHDQGLSVVCVFEGVDAAGKGGAIRRLVTALDAGIYRIIPVAKPTEEEFAHHYLWRFWRHLPDQGFMTIFDRSWYGRVLVERVEGFAQVAEWQRAYDEINDFEQQLTDRGMVLVKYWLHIDQDEQLKRFKARERTPYKQHKITEEDYRNRKKWPAYRDAINDMLYLTNSAEAPWTVIAAQDKKHARLRVLETLITALENRLKQP